MRRSQGKEIVVRGVRSTFDSRPSRTNALWHLIGQDHRIEEHYHIPAANFLGHADVAPRRKTDPSGYFPWKKLADQGFGLWCDPPYPEPPAAFDTALALRALGYDTGDAAAAVRAFKLYFQPDASGPELDERGRALLYCLYRKSPRAATVASRRRQFGEADIG